MMLGLNTSEFPGVGSFKVYLVLSYFMIQLTHCIVRLFITIIHFYNMLKNLSYKNEEPSLCSFAEALIICNLIPH